MPGSRLKRRPPETAPASRFASVDAFRGLTVAAMLLVNDPGDWNHVYAPLEHAPWNGCTPTDLIFPCFLFIVGVSIALGLLPQLARGAAVGELRTQALWRAARIVALGLLLHAVAWWALDRPDFRPWGVLQRIGVCFGAAALIALHGRARAQWAWIVALLVGYGALLAADGGTAPWRNVASRVDAALLGAHAYVYDAGSGHGHDPEGLLSTLPAIATTLLGVRAGAWLRDGALRRLWIAGAAALTIGLVWAQTLPFNKNLWTPSYALWTAGWAMWALAASHWLVDRRGWPPLGRAFGINAIAAYAGSALMVYLFAWRGWWTPIYRIGFADWMTPRFGPYLPSLAFALVFVAFWWAVVAAMARRGWRITI